MCETLPFLYTFFSYDEEEVVSDMHVITSFGVGQDGDEKQNFKYPSMSIRDLITCKKREAITMMKPNLVMACPPRIELPLFVYFFLENFSVSIVGAWWC